MASGKKIMVVDDEPNIRDLLYKFFSREGYQCFVAKDAEEATAILKSKKPDIVFLDIKLPGIGGVDILKMTKQYDQDVSVVMISGHADENTAKETLQLGAFEYICKPIDLERIREILAQIEIAKFANNAL
ncbi:MAG: response regulator [bacterium]